MIVLDSIRAWLTQRMTKVTTEHVGNDLFETVKANVFIHMAKQWKAKDD